MTALRHFPDLPKSLKRSNFWPQGIVRAIGTTCTVTYSPGRMFWLWWKTLSGSYLVFTFASRS